VFKENSKELDSGSTSFLGGVSFGELHGVKISMEQEKSEIPLYIWFLSSTI